MDDTVQQQKTTPADGHRQQQGTGQQRDEHQHHQHVLSQRFHAGRPPRSEPDPGWVE